MLFSSLLLFMGLYLEATATPDPGIAALVARVIGRSLERHRNGGRGTRDRGALTCVWRH
jgi:threonine/homoserine/homoserine lactone efflux protein